MLLAFLGDLKGVHCLNVLLLVPQADALQVDVSVLLSPLDEKLVVELLKSLLDLFVLRLLQLEHSAGQDCKHGVAHALSDDLKGTRKISSQDEECG